ncbi:MAG: uncharacterized protein JWO68_3032 [Actinomycetia bacterium]|nr:uncharacterized protein [Actinomycetes bacterium]
MAFWNGYEPGSHGPVNPPVEYAFIQCDVCGLPSIQAREDYGEGFDQDEPGVIYPRARRVSFDIPAPLRAELEEAFACLRAKAYTATVVMVRRTLEGTCKESGVSERTLHASLKKMRAEEKIDDTLAEWADALRVLGNQGAHYTGHSVSREDAEDALDFAEALLDHLYVLKKRFDSFMARRAAE